MKSKSGAICIVLAAIFWGLIGLFVRALERAGFESIQIVAIRAIGATIVLAIFFSIRDKSVFKIKIKDLWIFLGTGIGSMVFFNFCYFGSIERTSLAIAAALLYTAPAFVAILARIFLNEKLSASRIAAIAMAIFGCIMTSGIFTSLGGIDIIGFLLGIGSGLGYALYSIFGKFAIDRGYKSSTITFYTFLVAMVCTSYSLLEGPSANAAISDIFSMTFIISVAGLVIISTIMAYILYTKGLSQVPASYASVLASIEPVVATIISILVFRESMSWDVLLGFCIILISTVIVSK